MKLNFKTNFSLKMARQELYLAYEHAVVRQHTSRFEHITRHWTDVPEEWLFESGYINNFSSERQKRLMYKKKGSTNRARDFGFDGMARLYINEEEHIYFGIQAKYYAPPKLVRCEDIGTFMAMQMNLTTRNSKSKGYLYTLDKLQPDLRCNVANPDYPIQHIMFPWTQTTNEIREVKESELKLRPYQIEAINFLKNKEGINGLNIPCRMGKTVIAGHLIKDIDFEIIIAIAPLKASVENLQERLSSFVPSRSALLVDSDYYGTTDIEQIRNFICNKDNKKIIYTTYKSAIDIIQELYLKPANTEAGDYSNAFILVDEVHNATDDICDFINRFSNGLVLSATLPEDLNIELNEVYKMSFADAIAGGYVVDYNLWLPHLIRNADGTTTPDVEIPIQFSHYEADLTAKVFYLTTVMLKTGSRRCIVYLNRQEDCDSFNLICKDVFDKYHGLSIWIDKIDANVSSNKRKEILRDFQAGDMSQIKIISSVRILDEAIDIPLCDSVFITNVGEQSSDIRMMQRSQRSSTKVAEYPGKINNIFLWASGWEKCIASLELLREADPKFFKKVRIADANYDKSSQKERIEEIKVEVKSMNEYMNMKCMTVLDRHKMMIEKIKKFYEEHKRCPKQGDKNGIENRLAEYIAYRRGDKKRGKLSKVVEEIIKEQLPWLSLGNAIWENHYKTLEELSNFYSTFDDTPKQKGTRTPNESILASYISSRRQEKKNGKLNPELETLLFEKLHWFTFDPFMDQHIKTINEIADFYQKFGEAPTTSGTRTPDEGRLAAYIQQKRLDGMNGKLKEGVKELIKTKLPWVSFANAIMERHIKTMNAIADFYTTYKRAPKNGGTQTPDESRLAHYIINNRQHKKEGKMSTELLELFNTKLPWLNLNNTIWEHHIKTVEQLASFYDVYKEPPKIRGTRETNEAKLYEYIISRRKDKKEGILKPEVEELITSKLPWMSFENSVMEQHIKTIDELKLFYDEFKDKPKQRGVRTPNESSLALYIGTRKKDAKAGRLNIQVAELIKEKLPWLKLD